MCCCRSCWVRGVTRESIISTNQTSTICRKTIFDCTKHKKRWIEYQRLCFISSRSIVKFCVSHQYLPFAP
jgi:hypothetical protein